VYGFVLFLETKYLAENEAEINGQQGGHSNGHSFKRSLDIGSSSKTELVNVASPEQNFEVENTKTVSDDSKELDSPIHATMVYI